MTSAYITDTSLIFKVCGLVQAILNHTLSDLLTQINIADLMLCLSSNYQNLFLLKENEFYFIDYKLYKQLIIVQ